MGNTILKTYDQWTQRMILTQVSKMISSYPWKSVALSILRRMNLVKLKNSVLHPAELIPTGVVPNDPVCRVREEVTCLEFYEQLTDEPKELKELDKLIQKEELEIQSRCDDFFDSIRRGLDLIDCSDTVLKDGEQVDYLYRTSDTVYEVRVTKILKYESEQSEIANFMGFIRVGPSIHARTTVSLSKNSNKLGREYFHYPDLIRIENYFKHLVLKSSSSE